MTSKSKKVHLMGYPMGNDIALEDHLPQCQRKKKSPSPKLLQGPGHLGPSNYYCVPHGFLLGAAFPRGTIRQWLHRQI